MKVGSFAKNSRGFTLPEIMVGVGIVGIIGLALATQMVFFVESNNWAQFRAEVIQMQPTLAEHFRGNPGCNCLVQGKTYDTSDPSASITFPATTIVQNAFYSVDPSDPTACATLTNQNTLIDGTTGAGLNYSTLDGVKIDRLGAYSAGYYLAHVTFTFKAKQKVVGPDTTNFDFLAAFKGTPAGSIVTLGECVDPNAPDPEPTPPPALPPAASTAWAFQLNEWVKGKHSRRDPAQLAAIRGARPSCPFGNRDEPLIYGACTVNDTCNSEGKKGDAKYTVNISIYKCVPQ